MSRPASSRSVLSSTVKENRPAWYGGCSPGRPNTLVRTGVGKPLGEIKSVNRGDGTPKTEKPQMKKKVAVVQHSPSGGAPAKCKQSPPAAAAATAAAAENLKAVTALVTSRPKSKAPVKSETPPPSRPKKAISALVTPTGKSRKPLATLGTPTNRVRERSQSLEGTPTRKIKERPSASGGSHDSAKSREKSQPFSAWAYNATRIRRGSTPGRAQPKPMFLSPQASKKNVRKEPLRKSLENHGIWVGNVPKRRSAAKVEIDAEIPPAQPTNSPEIPKRGSREASGEGARGYFGAGPMVAPEGMGLVRDRRKCKPRGMLVVGNEGLSIDSDSSGIVESSIQVPLPSVASVEWMNREEMLGGVHSSSSSVPESFSGEGKSARELSGEEFYQQLKQSRGSRGDWTKQQLRQSRHSRDGSYQQMRQSRPSRDGSYQSRQSRDGLYQPRQSGDSFYQTFRSSQLPGDSFLQQTSRSQFSREGTPQLIRLSKYSENGILQSSMQSEHSEFTEPTYEDVTIDWRQGLPPSESSSRASQDVSKSGELVGGSVSFASSWAPPPEERRSSGIGKTWYPPDSSWYGFSPITPEFHRVSQLPEGGSKLIDALVAGSVRRRIMTEQEGSDEISSGSEVGAEPPNKSLVQSFQAINVNRSMTSSSFSSRGSQDVATSIPFSFATRRSFASIADLESMGPIPVDNYMCQTASPIEGSDDLICQTASPINEVCSAAVLDCEGRWSEPGIREHTGWDEAASHHERWDEEQDSDEDGVEYASPVAGDFLSPVKAPSLSASPERDNSTDARLFERSKAVRASRRSSMSRTLEELMRHNLHL